MNPTTTDNDTLDPADTLAAACLCHDAAACPDQATVTVPAAELADLAELLGIVDEFLRCGNGAAGLLGDFYARRGEPHPGFLANNLIDAVSFTAATLHRHRNAGRW